MNLRPALLLCALAAVPAIADTVTNGAVVIDDIVVLSPVSQGAAPAGAGTGIATATGGEVIFGSAASGERAVAGTERVVFAPLPAEQIAALPLAAGMPRPSIIVGLIEPVPASFPAAEEETEAAGTEISFADTEAWLALRASDPALFRSLVEGGAFDPPEGELARALQTELQRVGCYTSSIDGDFGVGSRRAVGRFFDEAGTTPVSTDPVPELFRQILLAGEVECQAVAVNTTRPASGGTRQPSGQPTTTTAAPAPAPAPKPAGGLGNAGLGSGVFR